MAFTNSNRKILDLKRWEFCTPAPAATAAGSFIISSRHVGQRQLFVRSATEHYVYYPWEDGWIQIPSGALAGTFGAGSCGNSAAVGPQGTATGGSSTTLNTNLTLARNLKGYWINITGGPGAGDTRQILYSSVGANGIITVTSPFSATITSASTYRLFTPRWYVLNAGTLAAGSFKYYCYALNTWTSLAITGLPATWGTDGRMVMPFSFQNEEYVPFATGTSSGTNSSTTLNDTTKTWTASQWVNYQIRISGGLGAGQIRTITASTPSQVTVAAWTITPDATSTYSIEGNDDFIYFMGNNAVTLYRYSISGNTTTTLTPGVARAAAPGLAASAHWVYNVTGDARWADPNAIINGRRIYSFRGGAGAILDYYDIPSNAWTNAVPYAPAVDTLTTGTKYALCCDYLYIQKDATGRWFQFSFERNEMRPWNTALYPGSTAILGDTAFDIVYRENGSAVYYIYYLLNTSAVLLRQMVI